VEMPEMNGLEATRRIRDGEAGARNQNVPIVAMTAHAQNDFRLHCLQSGMNDYISKPVDFQEALAIISRVTVNVGPVRTCRQTVLAATVLNAEQALQRLDNDKTLYHELCAIFLDQLPLRCAAMHQALAAADMEEARFIAHSLKNMCGAVGLESCQAHAHRLEEAARRADTSVLDRLWFGFESERDHAIAALNDALLL